MKIRLSPEEYKEKKRQQKEFLKNVPPFSGRSYDELNDIYPIDLRIKDDVWRLVGLMKAAFVVTQRQFKDQLPTKLKWCRFEELCWMQRCEERKEGFAFIEYPAIKGLNISGAIFAARKAELIRLGLVEQIPIEKVKKARIFRVTWLGKMVIKSFVENLTQANNNLEEWLMKIHPEEYLKITKSLAYNSHRWTQTKRCSACRKGIVDQGICMMCGKHYATEPTDLISS